MRAVLPLVSCFLVGCEAVNVHFPAEPLAGDPPGVVLPPTDPVNDAPAAFTFGEAVECRAPTRRDFLGPYTRRVGADFPTSQDFLWSGGILAGDLDNDGLMDLVAPEEEMALLYRGRPGGTLSVWGSNQLGIELDKGTGGSLADYDADGDLDILMLRWNRPNVLLRNDGDGRFTDVSMEAWWEGQVLQGASTTSAWADMDKDGDLDLFVGSYGDLRDDGITTASYLFENVEGQLLDRSSRLPQEVHEGFTRVAGFHDLDLDGYPDLYVTNDLGLRQSNVLLWNDNGKRFVADDGSAGLNLQLASGGLGVGDLNDDAIPDFVIPQWDRITILESRAGGFWVESLSRLPPIQEGLVGWGAELADVDNDGDLDVAVAYGHFEVDVDGYENLERQPDALYLQQEDGTFIDVAPEWGVDDDGTQRGFVVVDMGEDGWLDLVKRDLNGGDVIHVSRCGTNHWLKVHVRQSPSTGNVFGVGAHVRVVAADGTTWRRTVTAGGTGFGSGGPPELHFGLGDVLPSRLEVTWPDGRVSIASLDSVGPDRRVTVTREGA